MFDIFDADSMQNTAEEIDSLNLSPQARDRLYERYVRFKLFLRADRDRLIREAAVLLVGYVVLSVVFFLAVDIIGSSVMLTVIVVFTLIAVRRFMYVVFSCRCENYEAVRKLNTLMEDPTVSDDFNTLRQFDPIMGQRVNAFLRKYATKS